MSKTANYSKRNTRTRMLCEMGNSEGRTAYITVTYRGDTERDCHLHIGRKSIRLRNSVEALGILKNWARKNNVCIAYD